MTEGTIDFGTFDLERHRQDCLAAAEAEPDPHKAFHLRSGMPLPDAPDAERSGAWWLCVTCSKDHER